MYPRTSETGVAYYIPSRGQTFTEILATVSSRIQYSCRQITKIGPQKGTTKVAFFHNASCHTVKYGCSGVKACEYLDPSIINMAHGTVTDAMSDQIRTVRGYADTDDILNYANR